MNETQSSVRRQIDRTNAEFMDAFRRGDAAGAAALYTKQCRLYPPDLETQVGKEAIRDFWQGVMDMGVADIALETLEFEVQGDTAWESGRATLKGKDGALLATAKYIVIWKSENGEWRLHRDIWNSSKAAVSQQGVAAEEQQLRKFTATLQPGRTEYRIDHGLGTLDVLVQTRIMGRIREGGVSVRDSNTVEVVFGGVLNEPMDVVVIG